MKTLTELAALLGLELGQGGGDADCACVAGSGCGRDDALVFAEDRATLSRWRRVARWCGVTTPALAAQVAGLKPVMTWRNSRDCSLPVQLGCCVEQSGDRGSSPAATVAEERSCGEEVSISRGRGGEVGRAALVAERILERALWLARAWCWRAAAVIYPRAVLYAGTTLGDRVVVHAGAVLGADGFGYVRDATNGEYLQFPQQGTLVLEDDVEVGANSTIDRGALEETRVGRGTKIDNLVHIGHNCRIGRNVVIASTVRHLGLMHGGRRRVLGGAGGYGRSRECGRRRDSWRAGGRAAAQESTWAGELVLGHSGEAGEAVFARTGDACAQGEEGAGLDDMAVVVVGGNSRNIGKTSVVAGLIARLPEMHWTAFKITQHGHHLCDGRSRGCDCIPPDALPWNCTEETNRTSGKDSARFLYAGAVSRFCCAPSRAVCGSHADARRRFAQRRRM